MIARVRIVLWGLVAVALVAALALALQSNGQAPGQPQARAPQSPGDGRPVMLGAPFTLTDADGRRFPSSRLAGRPYALFFGFTHCPDVCPTTLARLARLRAQLGGRAAGGEPAIVFVSVDPERDTPAELKRYASLFDTPLVMLTGTPGEIATVKRNFGIFSEKVAQPGGGYTVDHTATVLLFDRDGAFRSTIAPDEGDVAALAKLRALAG